MARRAVREFEGLELGGRIPVGKEEWIVVGIFEANGGISESEIWTDASVLQPAFRRGNSFQAVYAKLETPEVFQGFKDRLTTDPRLNVKVVRQDDYYAEQSTAITGLITGLGTLIAGLMGIGAVFGALNTMYSAVSSRTREIATLRALGFGSGPVVISVMVEALVLAIVGGAIGAGLAYVAFDGFRAATMELAELLASRLCVRRDASIARSGHFLRRDDWARGRSFSSDSRRTYAGGDRASRGLKSSDARA